MMWAYLVGKYNIGQHWNGVNSNIKICLKFFHINNTDAIDTHTKKLNWFLATVGISVIAFIHFEKALIKHKRIALFYNVRMQIIVHQLRGLHGSLKDNKRNLHNLNLWLLSIIELYDSKDRTVAFTL